MKPPDAADHAAAIDWPAVAAALDERGYATAGLLTTEECRELAALYSDDDSFRRRIVMQHHAYGRGEYKYFRYPLPGPVRRCAGRSIRALHRSPIGGISGCAKRGGFRRFSTPISPSATARAKSGRRR